MVACRVCDASLDRASLFTIPAPLVSAFPRDATTPRVSAPIEVVGCGSCGHVQPRHSVDPAHLYSEYWYLSGVNERMRQELLTIVQQAQQRVEIDRDDAVLDIGANDGTLLAQYPPWVQKVAVEPAATFAEKLSGGWVTHVAGLFPQCVAQIPDRFYKVISTVAMFYDLDDPVRAAQVIRRFLHPQGVWICQFQDLEQQVRAGAWDNTVHEHVSYYTLHTFNEVVRRAGLQVSDVEMTTINGGSLRVYVTHPHAHFPTTRVQEQYFREFQTLEGPWAARFQRRMRRNVAQLRAMIASVTGQGGTLDLYGASTKGNTLLQVLDLPAGTIRQAWERNPAKVGRLTVTGVPIVDEASGRADPPDALLTSIWQFRSEIIARERETLKTVPLILPLPEATWVGTWKT